MNWCPRFTDKPFRLVFDAEVWLVLLAVMGLMVMIGVNQALSIVSMGVIGYFLQKTIDKNTRGYIFHLLCKLGILRYFPFGKFRI